MSFQPVGQVSFLLQKGIWSPRDQKWDFVDWQSFHTDAEAVKVGRDMGHVAYRVVKTTCIAEWIPPRVHAIK